MISELRREIGVIGLGKMGSNIAHRLLETGWTVHGYDQMQAAVQQLQRGGMKGADSLGALLGQLSGPRLVWLMVPAGPAVDEVLFGADGIVKKLSRGDIIIDGGNSYYKDSIARAKKVAKMGIKYIDVGFSGGPSGARKGACLMVGGDEATFNMLKPLFRDLSVRDGYQFFKGAGAGHFVKMVHNGIEYGMMQSLAEGFAILKKSKYKLDLARVADAYNHGSVIQSRLVGWARVAFEAHGRDLTDVSGTVRHTGEGAWTVQTAKEMGLTAKIIEESLKFRVRSGKYPDYVGKIVSALREQFGGHSIKK